MRETRIRYTCGKCNNFSEWFDAALYPLIEIMRDLRSRGWKIVGAHRDCCPACSGKKVHPYQPVRERLAVGESQ